jgi:HEAT repeat protein
MIEENILQDIFHGLRSGDANTLKTSVRKAKSLAHKLGDSQIRDIADGLTSLFYLDTIAQPGYKAVVEDAISALVALGPKVVPVLIEDLADSDLNANVFISHTLARLGKPAAAELIEEFRHARNPYRRTAALYALSLMDDPALIEVFPDVVSALDSDNPELRDTAARAIGNMISCLGGACLSPKAMEIAFTKLLAKVSDPHGGTRSKAIQSIGKMAKAGYLGDARKKQALDVVQSILGIDGRHEWDSAFNVRREAEIAYQWLTGKQIEITGPCGQCREPTKDEPGFVSV